MEATILIVNSHLMNAGLYVHKFARNTITWSPFTRTSCLRDGGVVTGSEKFNETQTETIDCGSVSHVTKLSILRF